MKTVTCPGCGARVLNEEKVIIRKSKLLIGEGKDEEHFFKALLQQLGLDNIQILGIGGKDRLKEQLKALILDPAWRQVLSIGILRDADDDPGSAFKSVCDALKDTELPVPKKTMVPAKAKAKPTVQIMILPDSMKQGALEDLCLSSITNESATVCVEQYFQCLTERGVPGPKKADMSKARARVFLASQNDPTLPLGIAAQRGYWPLDSKIFADVKSFILSI